MKLLMKTSLAFRFWSPALLPTVLFTTFLTAPASTLAQGPPQPASPGKLQPAATRALLDSAHALEERGRMDLATQRWQQVLLAEPNNAEALGGLARAAKLGGNLNLANTYLDRLRAVSPNDPGIARVEQMGTQADHNVQLQQAGKLAQQGQYAQSMNVYRQVYGDQPPPGDQALAFYETESATEDGRPHAVAGLRNLVQKFPSDARYQVALGRILTYNPKTRPEGRKLLAAHATDPEAVEALRQSLLWDSQNPATASDIKAYLAHHPDSQLNQALHDQPRSGSRPAAPMTADQRAAAAVNASRTAEDRAAYQALNAKRIDEAENRFKAILARKPDEANALAGMGYIRMQQANFGGAISFLSQAKQDGSRDPGLDAALTTSRFWYTMGEGSLALNANDLPSAEKQYTAALSMRRSSPEALEGLGGTLLKAQQPEAAIPVFAEFVKVKPTAAHAWRGLFLAQAGAGDAPRALATEHQIPPAVRAELMRDPLFLVSLSSAYSSVGRDADAQRVLQSALDLPFPANSQTLEADTQLQYAGLLQQANRLDQAAGLYQQVLAKDQNNTAAWEGLVRTEHAMSQDDRAVQTLESIPPATFATAMRDPAFEQTVASIYQGGKRLDVAQDVLEKALAQQAAANQKPSVPSQIQLAGIYLQRNNPQAAYPLYRQILSQYPDRTDAWNGLLSSLHSTDHDSEALAQAQQIPDSTRARLENDPDFLQTMAAVYNALGQSQRAGIFLRRVQQHYAQANTQAPAEIDVQNAWLLYNGMNDRGLYSQLLSLGGRTDLTDAQRRTVQTIWANWAVRRASQAAALGDTRRAQAILNATAQAFPDNPEVIKTLAGGYASAGLSRQAIAIWKAEDLKNAPAADYRAAIGSALAANDQKDAETWLRFGLDQYPKDAALLALGARFEEARGDNNRAADYYRASLKALPPADPGAELSTELGRPQPVAGGRLPRAGQDLATLLTPGKDAPAASSQAIPDSVPNPLYLPGSGTGAGAPVPMYNPGNSDTQSVPSYPSPPTNATPTNAPATTERVPAPRLRDFVPQASVNDLVQPNSTHAQVQVIDSAPFSEVILSSAALQQHQIQQHSIRLIQASYIAQNQQSQTPPPPTPAYKPGPLTTQPADQAQSVPSPAASAQTAPAQTTPAQTKPDEVYGPYVPYHPPAATAVQLGTTPPVHAPVQPEVTDVLPTAHYVPNATSRPASAARSEANAAEAARRRQAAAAAARSGQSQPPAEEYNTAPTETVQYNPAQAAQGAVNNGSQVAQPTGRNTPQPAVQMNSYPAPQTGDSNGQQYPQPYTTPRASTVRGRARAKRHIAAPIAADSSQPVPPTVQPSYQGLSYPGVGQPLTYQPYPQVGPAYPLGTPPNDADLMARRLPPLRGGYSTEAPAAQVPLTPRQQTERDLETLEASYSGWLGGTASARYRSGTQGLDRLTDLEATFEASYTAANNVRFTIVPRAVFLNSGTLDLTTYAGNTTTNVPFNGTLPLNTINQPAQQNISGVGGELQVSARNFAVAVGYTPYEFLVRNVTGRAPLQAQP